MQAYRSGVPKFEHVIGSHDTDGIDIDPEGLVHRYSGSESASAVFDDNVGSVAPEGARGDLRTRAPSSA